MSRAYRLQMIRYARRLGARNKPKCKLPSLLVTIREIRPGIWEEVLQGER
jgi:hypothetical protein